MDHHTENISINEFGNLSTSFPSTYSRMRKNEKLQAIYDRQQAKNNLQVISNRVNQLKKIKKQTIQEIENLKKQIKEEKENNA